VHERCTRVAEPYPNLAASSIAPSSLRRYRSHLKRHHEVAPDSRMRRRGTGQADERFCISGARSTTASHARSPASRPASRLARVSPGPQTRDLHCADCRCAGAVRSSRQRALPGRLVVLAPNWCVRTRGAADLGIGSGHLSGGESRPTPVRSTDPAIAGRGRRSTYRRPQTRGPGVAQPRELQAFAAASKLGELTLMEVGIPMKIPFPYEAELYSAGLIAGGLEVMIGSG
jgi:hypothetical protein